MAMATMATSEVLRSAHGCVLASSLPLSGTNVSPTSSAFCRANARQILSRKVHIASSRLESGSSSSIRICNSGLQGIGFSHSPCVWNPLSARRSARLVVQAKKVAEVEVSADKVSASVGDEEEEVEISWVQEKAEDLIIATGQAIDRVPGPRVAESRVPWLVALPLAYLGITFVVAVYRTYKKYTSPRGQRKRQVGKNAFLCESLGEYFPAKRDELDSDKLQKLASKCNFTTAEVLRKYVRYVLNERPFTPETVADLLHLRKVSGLSEPEVAEVLNDVAKRIVKAKGPVIMNTEGFTEKGIKRKAAVQALFSKLLYLSELEEFVTSDNRSALTIKTTFGVTDDDANLIRIDTLSEQTDVESLERMVGSAESDDEEASSPASENNEK
ncbi:hypothetical protein KC19_1G188200 [Ceratodon purpureus]|uniref:Armadillo-like repeats domain-containing protein n=1 Tax=Ceratodon purpureus TaxID=3225 RepID=A0A8T0J9M9_CERPU|nr:hypothetical protein KC19_1G188200 [Ceratodon purpureus]